MKFNELDIKKNICINNGNRTEWSPIRSVIIRAINKIGRPRSGVRLVYHEVSAYSQLSEYTSTECSLKNEAADAPIIFEEIVMVMIKYCINQCYFFIV